MIKKIDNVYLEGKSDVSVFSSSTTPQKIKQISELGFSILIFVVFKVSLVSSKHVTVGYRVSASVVSNYLAKTRAGILFTDSQTDRQTDTHTHRQTNCSENVTPPRFRGGSIN